MAEAPTFPTSTVARIVAASPATVWSIVSEPARFAALYPIHLDGQWTGIRSPGIDADIVFPSELLGRRYLLRSTVRQWIPELVLAFDSGIDDQPRGWIRAVSIAPHDEGSLVTLSTSRVVTIARLELVARSVNVPRATRRTLGLVRGWDRAFLQRLAFTAAVQRNDQPVPVPVPAAG